MDPRLLVLTVGALLVTGVLLNVAARHVTADMVPAHLQGRLRVMVRVAPLVLVLVVAVALGSLAAAASHFATGL